MLPVRRMSKKKIDTLNFWDTIETSKRYFRQLYSPPTKKDYENSMFRPLFENDKNKK